MVSAEVMNAMTAPRSIAPIVLTQSKGAPVDKVLSASSAPGTGAKIHRTQSINHTDLSFAVMRQFPE